MLSKKKKKKNPNSTYETTDTLSYTARTRLGQLLNRFHKTHTE